MKIRNMIAKGADAAVALVLIAVIASVYLGICAAYGDAMYDDWRCGMPTVQCLVLK